jgi:hypothetical protein
MLFALTEIYPQTVALLLAASIGSLPVVAMSGRDESVAILSLPARVGTPPPTVGQRLSIAVAGLHTHTHVHRIRLHQWMHM